MAKRKTKTGPGAPVRGLFTDWPYDRYELFPAVRNGALSIVGEKSPAHYAHEMLYPRPETRAKSIGRALHCLLLEPETFNDIYIADPYGNSRSREAKAERAELEKIGFVLINDVDNDDRGVYGLSDWKTIHKIADAIRSHPIARLFLKHGRAELTGIGIDDYGAPDIGFPPTGLAVKFRPDFDDLNHDVFVDVKTTDDASRRAFDRSVRKFGYHRQAAWYLDHAAELDYPRRDFVFIAAEKFPPFGVAVYTLDPEFIRAGRHEYRRDLAILAEAMAEKEYSGYPLQIGKLEYQKYR